RRAEPGVEDVFILLQRFVATVMIARLQGGTVQILGDEHGAVRSVPGGDAVAPPKLTGNAPRLDVTHPGEEGVLPLFWNKNRLAGLHRLDRRLGQGGRVAVPLG